MHRLALLVLAIAAITAACQSGAGAATPAPATNSATQPPIATPETTVAATPAATLPVALQRPTNLPTDGSCEDSDSSCLGVLQADVPYASKVFKPTVHFTLPVDGFINQFDGAGDIGIQRLDPAGDAIIFFRDPRATDTSVGTTVEDIATWIEANDDLDATPFEPAKLGGLKGLVMDVTTAAGATGGTSADCPVQACIHFLRGDDLDATDPYPWHWDWGTAGPEKLRLYLLTHADGTIAVVIDSVDGTTFDSIIDVWQKVAPTVKFG